MYVCAHVDICILKQMLKVFNLHDLLKDSLVRELPHTLVPDHKHIEGDCKANKLAGHHLWHL